MRNKKALIMVDLQTDFTHGGSLEVPEGDAVVPVANRLQNQFDTIIATQDWHPSNHVSFASNHSGRKIGDLILVDDVPQVLWPDHCVQNSKGAQFHPKLNTQKVQKIFHKGADKNIDSYSAFFDNEHKRSTGLGDYLHQQGIKDVYIMGLATDYCVKYSVLDALHLGFNVYVIYDACRGVELKPGDTQAALEEMQQKGAKLIRSDEVL